MRRHPLIEVEEFVTLGARATALPGKGFEAQPLGVVGTDIGIEVHGAQPTGPTGSAPSTLGR